jgi:hypothetical protein
MNIMRAHHLAVVALLLFACEKPSAHRELRLVPGYLIPVQSEESARYELGSFIKRAQADLGCADVVIEKRKDGNILRASGCSKRGVYARVLRNEPYDERTAVVAFELLSRPDTTSVGAARDPELAMLVEIVARGSQDLDCPRSEIVPELASWRGETLAVAEGCDKRATYLPRSSSSDELRLMAVVPARGAPTGFVTWGP